MRYHATLVLALAASLGVWATVADPNPAAPPPPAAPGTAAPAPPASPPGTAAPGHVVAEIQRTLDDAVRHFHTMDAAGVLAHVSAQYRTGAFTKRVLAEQLHALFAVHDKLEARIRIDDVRMVGDQAWIYSTGDVSGRLRWVGSSIPVLSWQRELEVARREGDRWRLFGYQQ